MIQNSILHPNPFIKAEKVLLTLNTSEGLIEVFECTDSGKIVSRQKIDTITHVFHPGIIIGNDRNGRRWVVHLHYSNGKVMFETLNKFSLGNPVNWDNRPVKFSPKEIIQRAIIEAKKGNKYHFLNYNCQSFVNLVVRDENRSEAVDRIANASMISGGIIFLLGAIFGNKSVMGAGLGIAGVAGAAKLVSRNFESF